MKLSLTQQQSMVLGLFVADAASLGLHWIYDFDHLQEIGRDNPVFQEPLLENYKDVFGFFAHGKRKAGDFSHYGETALLVLQNLYLNTDKFDLLNYQKLYRDHFGAGGSYVGYIDNPTRITLETLIEADYISAEIAKQIDTDLSAETINVVLQKVLPYTRLYQGEALVAPVSAAITVTYGEPEILSFALQMAKTIDTNRSLLSGADDQQLPALASAVLLSCFYQGDNFNAELEATVRVTNNNDNAVEAALFMTSIYKAILKGHDIESAISKSSSEQANQTDFIKQCLHASDDASASTNLKEASDKCGRTCYLNEGIPLSLWILTNSQSFEEAIKLNVLAGGDSCGRSYIIGAIAGAYYFDDSSKGIPFEWVSKLNKLQELSSLM